MVGQDFARRHFLLVPWAEYEATSFTFNSYSYSESGYRKGTPSPWFINTTVHWSERCGFSHLRICRVQSDQSSYVLRCSVATAADYIRGI